MYQCNDNRNEDENGANFRNVVYRNCTSGKAGDLLSTVAINQSTVISLCVLSSVSRSKSYTVTVYELDDRGSNLDRIIKFSLAGASTTAIHSSKKWIPCCISWCVRRQKVICAYSSPYNAEIMNTCRYYLHSQHSSLRPQHNSQVIS
jgi:hypothetical protein